MKQKLLLIGVSLMIIMTGCIGGMNEEKSDGLDKIPENNNMVLSIDGDVIEDKNLKKVVNAGLDRINESTPQSSETPQNYDELLSNWEEENNFEPEVRDINKIYAFGELKEEETDYGVILNANWEMDLLISSLRNNSGNLSEKDYKGNTIYYEDPSFGDNSYVSYLGNNQFVFSTSEEIVKSTIDVDTGDANSISGDVVDYINEEDTEVRFSANFNDVELPEENIEQYNFTSQDISMVNGYVDSKEGQIDLQMSIEASSSQVAGEIKNNINNQREMGTGQLEGEASSVIEETTVELNNNEVVIRNSININKIVTIIEEFNPYGEISDPPDEQVPDAPTAGVSVDLKDNGDNVVTLVDMGNSNRVTIANSDGETVETLSTIGERAIVSESGYYSVISHNNADSVTIRAFSVE
jgi:hypothetical protein